MLIKFKFDETYRIEGKNKHGRKICLFGRSMENNIKISIEGGYINHKEILIQPEELNNYKPSDVAILYEFRFVDKVIDEEKLLNFGDIVSEDSSFIRTGVDTYTGLFTLDDINNGKKANIHVDFYFDYLNDIEGITEDNQVFDDLFEIHFHAIQYKGEEIIPYSGG